MEQILFYRLPEPHGYMSNFHRSKIYVFGDWHTTSEHAYQTQKTVSMEERATFKKEAVTPRQAQVMGQKLTCRIDWDAIKDTIMYACLVAKFTQHHDLLEQLLATKDAELVEDSPVDWYWGWGKDRTGKNMLGKQLMEIREQLKNYHE